MSYVEIKMIKGRKYKYERKSIRKGNKVIHTNKYIGPVEPVNNRRNPNAGRKPALFVSELTNEEKEAIDKAIKSGNAFTRDRAKIILFSSQKIPPKEIAGKISCEVRKVRQAVKEFNKKKLPALQRGKAKGAMPKFSEATKQIVLLHFSKQPKDFGLHFTTWTLPRFKKHLIEFKVVDSISIETVRQILDKAGARLKRSKRWQYSPDKEFDKKKSQ